MKEENGAFLFRTESFKDSFAPTKGSGRTFCEEIDAKLVLSSLHPKESCLISEKRVRVLFWRLHRFQNSLLNRIDRK